MRLSVLCAAAGIAVTALAAAGPAEAAFNVIRWDNTGWCQVWGQSNPPTPWPSKYVALNKKPIASFVQALAEKDALVKKGACKFYYVMRSGSTCCRKGGVLPLPPNSGLPSWASSTVEVG